MPIALQRAAALAIMIATSAATGASAQETAADPSQPETTAPETMPSTESGEAMGQIQDTQPDQPGMLGGGMTSGPTDHATMGQGLMYSEMCSEMMDGMMGQEGMGQGMMDPRGRAEMMRSGQIGPGMHGHMMKVIFAVADADGNGGLSLDELAAIQGRVFATVDADKDGSVTPNELQAFMRE